MKKASIIFGMIFIAIICFAQENHKINEIEVMAPTFKGNLNADYNKSEKNPLSEHLQNQLNKQMQYAEFIGGKVIIDFVVNTDGSVSDYTVSNSVSHHNDRAVINAIKTTSGQWIPGQNNGMPMSMERRIVVNFYNGGTQSLQEIGISHYNRGVKKFYDSEKWEIDRFASEEKRNRKIANKLNTALTYLALATRYLPHEPCVVFWEAKLHNKLGNQAMEDIKNMEFDELVYLYNKPSTAYLAFKINR